VLTVALFVPHPAAGGFPVRYLIAVVPLLVPLIALGLRQAPRIGAALGLVGVGGSAWLWLAVRSGDASLLARRPRAPWGPLTDVFPRFTGDLWPYVLLVAVVAAAAVPVVREELEVRRRLS
jgi:hypothetical protein